MYEICSEFSETRAAAEAAALIRRLAEPAPAGAHIAGLIGTAARRVGLSASRAKAIWYREARRIGAHEMDRLRAAARQRDGGGDGFEAAGERRGGARGNMRD